MSTETPSPHHDAGVILTVAALAALVVMTVLGVHRLAEPRIEAGREILRQQQLDELLPHWHFDASRQGDTLTAADINTDDALPPVPILRFWQDEQPAAAVLTVTAPDGYNGDIELALALDAKGVVQGLRVVSHRETPGLGDDIETRKSDWITRFNGLSVNAYAASDWTVRSRGGRFDAFTGATITPQAVVTAVYRALVWYDANAEALFALPRE